MTCPSCGSDAPGTARFCPECGHAVARRGDERRVATVLFADLAGFTGLSEALDPEHLKNLVDRCFEALARDVTGHGGRVDKVIGDAIVALFGAPVAHEDDPERAVRAGLQMQRTVAALAAEMGVDLRLRVGINSGEVLVGAMRAGGDYTAMGDVVNVASRLQTMAEPGTVVVGEQTYASTARVVRYEALGALQPRGRDAAVRAWTALGASSQPGRRPRRVTVPLVGRDDEVLLLRHSLSAAVRRNRPTLALVLGEAGIGKTRLTEEMAAAAAADHGALVLEGRCPPYGEANPWWPIAEAVRRACGVDPGDSAEATAAKIRATVADVCPDDAGDVPAGAGDVTAGAGDVTTGATAAGLLHLIGDSEALPDVDPHRRRQEARRALHALIAGLASRQPVLFVLSELHWADEVVLELLEVHMERVSGLPVVVLATARPELLERWSPPHGRHDSLTLHLDPLDPGAAGELAALLSGRSLPAEVVDALVTRSGGNPLFLEELVSYVGDSAVTGGDTFSGRELPVSLRGLVAERLDALPADERSLLEDAAVIGRSGTAGLLGSLGAGRDRPDAAAALPRLYERDLLAPADHGWEFRSELVREVVYETLTKSDRARRHWAVAGRLADDARRTGRQDEVLEVLAHHYATAAELARTVGPVQGVPPDAGEVAVEALRRAARWVSRREFPLAASRLLDRAVDLAPADPAVVSHLLVERASERATIRDLEGARQDLDRVLVGADDMIRARALTILGVVFQIEGDLGASADHLRQALSLWRALGDRAGEGEALRRYGITCLQGHDVCGADDALSAALSIAQELSDRREEAWALWHLAELSFYSGRTDEAAERLHRAGRAFQEAGDVGGLGWVKGLLGYTAFIQGRRAEAEQIAVAILDQARDRGDPWALAMILLLLASVRLWQGQAGAAIGPAREAARMFTAINDLDGEMRATGVVARALAATGRAEDAWQAFGAVFDRTGSGPAHPALGVGGVATHLGDGPAGVDASGAPPEGFGSEEVVILRSLALLQVGRPEEARAVIEALMHDENRLSGTADPGLQANAGSVLALARVCCGDPEAALEASQTTLSAGPAATYRDLVLARLARAFAFTRQGRTADAAAEVGEAAGVAEATDDVVTAATVQLAAARISGDGPAAEEARSGLHALGAVPQGWDVLFAAAAAIS